MYWGRINSEKVIALIPWREKLFNAAVLQSERGRAKCQMTKFK